MMLNIFPSSMEKRYAIAGSMIGALTSLACLSAGLPTGHGFLSFFDSLANSPVLNGAIVACTLGFGYVAARAGRRLDEAERLLSAERSGVVELYHLAYHDALTGLGNRHALKRDTATLAGTDANGTLAALILIDLDRFKEINDTLGHDAGDAVLSALAKRLRAACDFDCRAYRLGGDEFVILAEGEHSPSDIEGFVQLLQAKVFKPVKHAGTEMETSGSLGISFLHGGDDTLSAALKRADLALYRAKERGDARHAFHVGPTDEGETSPHGSQRILRRAIEQGQLGVEYRPVWQSGTLKPRGFSAELLWIGCEAGARDRSDGLEIAMEEWLVETVMRDMADWPAHLCVALSLSMRTISRRGFANRLGDRIAQAGLTPERFALEVDFRALGRASGEGAEDNIAALRAIGVRIVSTDLVSGAFDIARAANSPVDCWRIDAARLRRTAASRAESQVVDAVADFAAAVGFELWFEARSDEDLAFAALFPNAAVSGWPAETAMTAIQAVGYAARSERPRRHLKVVG